MTGSLCHSLMLRSLLSRLIILTVSEFQLIVATYVWEYIRESLFSVLFVIISTQKKLDHVDLAIWPFNGREKSFFTLFAKVYVREMIKFSDFLNLQNFMVAKVFDLKVVQKCFKL